MHKKTLVGVPLVVALSGCVVQPNQESLFGLKEYKRSFFALGSRNTSENDSTPLGDIDAFEWNYQLSVRRDLHEFRDGNRLTFAYTNRTFWQITSPSARIRTTDNQPELFWETDLRDKTEMMRKDLVGLHSRVGITHQSNGEGGALSRSWNRLFVELSAHSNNWDSNLEDGRDIAWRLRFRPWLIFDRDEDNNPEVDKYFGHFELAGDHAWGDDKNHRSIASIMLRNNLRRSGNRGAVELTYSYGIGHGWRLFAQYFSGYGESLIDYDDSSNRFSVGVELSRAR